MNGTFDLILKDGKTRHIYMCGGQNYWIEEKTCNDRQARGCFKMCKRCTLRIDGKNDPRQRVDEIKNLVPERNAK
jgi:hypothetical protein